MPNFLELPFELVLAVVRFLSNEELRHLSLVCRHLRPDCQAMLLKTCTIPITLNRSAEEYRVLFQTPHFNQSIHFMSFRGRVARDGVPSADKQAAFAEVAGHIPTLHRLQCIEMTRIEPSILLLDAIFRSTFSKPMKLLLRRNTYPEEYRFPGQELKIHYIEAFVTNSHYNSSRSAMIARAFLPRLVSACAATLTSLHIYDDQYHTNMWDIPPVQLKSLTASATLDPSLVTFLQSQAYLEELRIRRDVVEVEGWASKLSRSDLPNLRSVMASYETLRYLVPGRAIREVNPDFFGGYLSTSYDEVCDFLHNTCPSAAGNGVESLDLGAVLTQPMGIQVLSNYQGSLSNIRNLGIPCHAVVRRSCVFPKHLLTPWKAFFAGLYLPQRPLEVDLSLSP